jgi:hypothetical protein
VVIAAAVLVVAAAVAWQAWTRWQAQQDAAVASRYVAAMNAADQSPAATIASLEQLAAGAPEGYRTLARLRAAGLKADAGDLQGALALWNEVAADNAADPLLRDLSSLMATQHQLDQGDPAQLEARLQPLAQPGNPWAPLAREQLAMLDLRQGKIDDAKVKLRVLQIDIAAPAGLRARAGALLAGLG